MASAPRVSGSERIFPTYRQIQIIEAIARYRSIGQAADALHMSQPAATRALKSVEDMLGVRLFDRTPNGVVSTVYLDPILKRVQSIHGAMRETERELLKLKDDEKSLVRISAGIHSIEIWCNRAIAHLVLKNTHAQISLESCDWNDLIDDLLAGRIDYAIGEISELAERRDIRVEKITELDLHFVCNAAHPLASGSSPDVHDISRYPMVGNKMVARLAARFRDQIGRLGEFDIATGGIYSAIRVTTLNAIKHVLMESDAVALMPIDSVRAEIAAGNLVALSRDAMPWLVGHIGFIAATSRQMTPLIASFREAVLMVEAQRRAQ